MLDAGGRLMWGARHLGLKAVCQAGHRDHAA